MGLLHTTFLASRMLADVKESVLPALPAPVLPVFHLIRVGPCFAMNAEPELCPCINDDLGPCFCEDED